MSFKKYIQTLITNPNIYIAAIIGTFVGMVAGGAVGLFSGGFISYTYDLCPGCVAPFDYVNPDVFAGGIMGLFIGSYIGGIGIGTLTIFKIHHKTIASQIITPDNLPNVLLSAFRMSMELSIGMAIGAVIGSLRLPGLGSVLGAVMGTMLILYTSTVRKGNHE